MYILCTNDDGYLATGLRTLTDAARSFGEVRVVAPDREQSAASHSLTMHLPLRVAQVGDGVESVTGTPTDCIALALAELLDHRPDLVLSGVNHGPNLGEDVLYSGTVAGAMEAAVFGIPAIAVSYVGRDADRIPEYLPLLRRLLPKLAAGPDAPGGTLFNVNLPGIEPAGVRGVRFTRLGRRVYSDSVTRARDPNGREYYWIGGGGVEWAPDESSDFHAVSQGYVSVTPLHLDLTHHRMLSDIRDWDLAL
ncbi:MAG TPA: 5'/3'-nucleotidase SurE [Longimicrobiaceae bacterium]|jgi:5'-nucleotidase|nr:5'/3'-nucleotidase SurE [Longimicrobiaceae bacterium]